MSDTDDDFEDNASLNSDSDMDDTDVGDEGVAEQDGEPQSKIHLRFYFDHSYENR